MAARRRDTGANSYVAVPVGIEFASDNTRDSPPALPTDGICGVLRIGQVWPGLVGNRIIVALFAAAAIAISAIIISKFTSKANNIPTG